MLSTGNTNFLFAELGYSLLEIKEVKDTTAGASVPSLTTNIISNADETKIKKIKKEGPLVLRAQTHTHTRIDTISLCAALTIAAWQ